MELSEKKLNHILAIETSNMLLIRDNIRLLNLISEVQSINKLLVEDKKLSTKKLTERRNTIIEQEHKIKELIAENNKLKATKKLSPKNDVYFFNQAYFRFNKIQNVYIGYRDRECKKAKFERIQKEEFEQGIINGSALVV